MISLVRRIAAAAACFLAAFLVTLVWALPLDLLCDRYLFPRVRSAAGITVTAAEAAWRPLATLALADVRVVVPLEKNPLEQRIETLRVSPGWQAILLRKAFALEAELAGGTFTMTSDGRNIRFAARELDCDRLAPVRRFMNWQVSGRLTVEGDVTPGAGGSKANGRIRIAARDVVLRDVALLGMKIPELRLDEVNGEMKIADGRVEMGDFRSRGGNATVALSGNLQLAKPLGQSPCDLLARVTLSEELRSAMQTSSQLLDMAKKEDGSIHVALFGNLASPNMGLK